MKILLPFICVILFSCNKKESNIPKIEEPKKFEEIEYNLSYDYEDSLAKKIKPNKHYKYWAFIAYEQDLSGESRTTILKSENNTGKEIGIKFLDNPFGFLSGCHPSYCCFYIATIEDKKISYITTDHEFKTFMGTIDNLEEAILLSRIEGYWLSLDRKGREYRATNNGYELRVLGNKNPGKNIVELEISKNGKIDAKTIGVYKERYK